MMVSEGGLVCFQVEAGSKSGVASCACQLHSNLLFFGSWLTNSLLVHVTSDQVSSTHDSDQSLPFQCLINNWALSYQLVTFRNLLRYEHGVEQAQQAH